MTKLEYDERMEYTNIYHHIKTQYQMQLQMLTSFNQMTQKQFDIKRNQLILHIVNSNLPAIARLGELYRKYNIAKYYERKSEQEKDSE